VGSISAMFGGMGVFHVVHWCWCVCWFLLYIYVSLVVGPLPCTCCALCAASMSGSA
jgi:hypothetical protein